MTNANNFFNHIERTVYIGLRKIEIVQDIATAENKTNNGKYFYFRINDMPIYAKGTNLIPLDVWST